MALHTFTAKPFTTGVHSEWLSDPMVADPPRPEVQVQTLLDGSIFIEVHNSEGYTAVELSPFTAEALGLRLIEAGAVAKHILNGESR